MTHVAGGCQCGRVRYKASSLGRASICHCRMCQKAFGGFFGPLVTADGFAVTRGTLALYDSSNKVTRGFCADCGTPLTYDWGGTMEVSIGSLDRPQDAPPVVQVNPADKLAFVDHLADLPWRAPDEAARASAFMADIVSNQHPDRDVAVADNGLPGDHRGLNREFGER